MTKKTVNICDACGMIADRLKQNIELRSGKRVLHFCGEGCVLKFYGMRKHRAHSTHRRKRRTKLKIADVQKRSNKGRKINQKHNPRYTCAACGLKCRNSYILGKHIKARHDPQEYMDLVRKTGGIVVMADGSSAKANESWPNIK
jgi:hypothetical protein